MLNDYVDYALEADLTLYRVSLPPDANANVDFVDGDYWSTPWFADLWRRTFTARLDAVKVRPTARDLVLDCSCGAGHLGHTLEREFGTSVVYCDISQRQLRTLATHGRASKAVCADLAALPHAPCCFDYVMGNSFLHHLPDVLAGLTELHRVLRPGGSLVLFHEPTVTANFWDSFPLSLVRDTSCRQPRGMLTDLWVFTDEDLQRLLRAAGFESIRSFGSGILSSLLVNWYLIVGGKLGCRSKALMYPAYLVRLALGKIELTRPSMANKNAAPSLMMVARKSAVPRCPEQPGAV
jgi:SAM-dependent methyltransferase